MAAAAAAAAAEKCQALPACSAAEQFPFGALCEPASLLIYLLVKEITIAVITGRYVSKSGVGLSEWCRVGVAEPAPQEAAIKRWCLEWYRDSSPSVGLRPETRAGWVWDWGAMEPVCLMTEGADSRRGSQMADTSEQHRPWLCDPQVPCCRLPVTGPLRQRHHHSEVVLVYEVWVGDSDGVT